MRRIRAIQAFSLLREPCGLVLTAGICAYSIWKGLQFVAVVALVGFLAIMYRAKVKYCLDQLIFLLHRATVAKYKDMEIKLGDGHPIAASGRVYSMYIAHAQPWVQIMIAQLHGHQIGLVLRIYREEKISRAELKAEDLDDLHSRGLIRGDSASTSGSDAVRLTESGAALAEALLQLEAQVGHS